MFRSKQPSRRSKEPTLEALEGRTMPSATPLPLVPLVPGHANLSSERVSQAIRAVDRQLLTAPAAAASQRPISVDLDRDGVLDTIYSTYPSGGSGEVLHVSYGGSERHPPYESTMALDHRVRRLMVGDFDGDGRLDIFAQEDAAGAGTLLLGRSEGLFDAYRQQEGRSAFAVADLKADGENDFVYCNERSAQVSVDLASGSRGVVREEGALPPADVQLADFDADGKPDLAVTVADGSIAVYAGLGNGQFSSHPQVVADLFAGTGPVHVAFAHLLGQAGGGEKAQNPYLDMVVASTARSEVAVFLGQKDWGLLEGQIMSVGLAPSSVIVRDVTGDGIPDLVVTSAGSNSLWILRGLGNGRFDDKHPLILPTGEDPVGVYAGDFTGDGKTDLVTLDRQSNGLTYYKNLGGSFAPPQHLDSGGTGPTTAVVRDGNDEGASDLIVANHDDGRVTIFHGSPDGLHKGQTIERPGSYPTALAVGPGTQPGNQVYVLYENEDRAEVLTFSPLRGDATPTAEAEAPALDSPSEVRIVLQHVGGTSVYVVPTLLVELPETDEAPVGGKQKPTTNTEQGSGGIAVKPQETAPGEESSGSSAEMAAQRYLLGVDEVPAPPLEPAGVISSLAPAVRTESEGEGPADEPSPSVTRVHDAIPIEDAEFEGAMEEMTTRESEVLADSDLLIAVLLIVGSSTSWAEQPTRISSWRDAGKLDRR